ncbi:MAG: polysaccharide pyruvyl transferase family protein [Candidatus Bathyarchaeia archaeon]
MDQFEKTLNHFRTERFAVFVPEGNNGDKLISLGLEKKLSNLKICFSKHEVSEVFFSTSSDNSSFFNKAAFLSKVSIEKASGFTDKTRILTGMLDKMNHKLALRQSVPKNMSDVIIINGGGNINDYYPRGKELMIRIVKENPRSVIIVGPETFYFLKDSPFIEFLKKISQEIFLFCREKYSYNLMNSINLPNNVNICLSDDTALYLSSADLAKITFNIPHPSKLYDLVCLRTDKESAVKRSILTKELKNDAVLAKDISEYSSFPQFVSLAQHAERIYTDRLHVAILGSIFGKKTCLFPNSYFKNKGVFEYSLFKKPCMKFVQNPELLTLS